MKGYANTSTHTERDRNGQPVGVVRLHGHLILVYAPEGLTFTLAGWPTVLTRRRLNALLPRGFHVFQDDYRQYFHRPDGSSQAIDVNAWYRLNTDTNTVSEVPAPC